MRKRATRKSSAAKLLESPLDPPLAKVETRSPIALNENSPPLTFALNFDGLCDIANSLSKKSSSVARSRASASKAMQQPTGLSLSPNRNVNTISDLKDLANSNLDSLKRLLEKSHREILKDVEASVCRIQKRYKVGAQECRKMADEAEKEYKKVSDGINEGREAMKASFADFISETQASANHFRKTSIIELAKASEKSIQSLRQRFGISADAA